MSTTSGAVSMSSDVILYFFSASLTLYLLWSVSPTPAISGWEDRAAPVSMLLEGQMGY